MSQRAVVLLPLVPYVLWLVFAYEYHFIDGVNLLFHEAGHIFFAFFGETMGFLGGTIGQLVFPVACMVHFIRNEAIFEAYLMGLWGCESLMYAAEYIGDAEAQVLPLVGGHIHDWNWLLSRWGILQHCEAIASGLHVIASLGAVACLGLAAAQLLAQREDAAPAV